MSDAEGVMESPDSSAEQSSSSGPSGELTIALPEGGAEEEPKTPQKRGPGTPRKHPKEAVSFCCQRAGAVKQSEQRT